MPVKYMILHKYYFPVISVLTKPCYIKLQQEEKHMKKLWNYIDKKNWKAVNKFKVACLILGFLSALGGTVLWLIIRIWALSSPEWLFCFIVYPILISFIVVVFYGYNHEFHNGRYS